MGWNDVAPCGRFAIFGPSPLRSPRAAASCAAGTRDGVKRGTHEHVAGNRAFAFLAVREFVRLYPVNSTPTRNDALKTKRPLRMRYKSALDIWGLLSVPHSRLKSPRMSTQSWHGLCVRQVMRVPDNLRHAWLIFHGVQSSLGPRALRGDPSQGILRYTSPVRQTLRIRVRPMP